MTAIFFEMNLIATTMHTVVDDGTRSRRELRTPAWQKHSDSLLKVLPASFASLLHIHYDQLEALGPNYQNFINGAALNRLERSLFLAWAFRTDRFTQHQNEWRRRAKQFWKRREFPASEQVMRVWDEFKRLRSYPAQILFLYRDIMTYSNQLLIQAGYDPEPVENAN